MKKTTGLVFSGAALASPLGSAAPPAVLQDESRFKNDGTFVNHTYWVQLPSGLWVLAFDGADDYISVPHNAALNITGDLTIETWVNRRAFGPIGTYGQITMKGAEADTPYELLFIDVDTSLFYLHQKSGGGLQQVFSSSSWALNTWWHLAATRVVGGNISIYRNGQLDIVPEACVGVPVSNNNNLVIGGRAGIHTTDGYYGLTRIYNRALTPAEIYAIYQAERGWFGV